ncbi:hypothetical protein RchiOBHm_Chr2g0105271 [Rosa chinensis]|uniref:Uncharacterized protein n=1 Tax=Rosa chinensis TaxID=74649 RepID=A0A2P6RND9_ROSCH|nr:hypothetical protein RchiOBHm_Chr2g0105271 [Rosa chinensis]
MKRIIAVFFNLRPSLRHLLYCIHLCCRYLVGYKINQGSSLCFCTKKVIRLVDNLPFPFGENIKGQFGGEI